MLTSGAHSIIYRLITQGCGKNTETPAKSAAYIYLRSSLYQPPANHTKTW